MPVFLAGCALSDPLASTFGPDGRTIREAIATFPEKEKEAFALARQRCSKCHDLNVPFAARVPAGSWRAQVRKMTRKPGAGIRREEVDPISGFFEFFSKKKREVQGREPD